MIKKRGKIWKGQIKNKAKDGSIYWTQTVIVPQKNEKGIPDKFLSIRLDITEQVKNSQEIKKLSVALDQNTAAVFITNTKGEIERYHRTIKNQIKLTNYYYPGELEETIKGFVEYYNNERYHESINNLKTIDVFNGISREILTQREVIKEITLRKRRKINLKKAS